MLIASDSENRKTNHYANGGVNSVKACEARGGYAVGGNRRGTRVLALKYETKTATSHRGLRVKHGTAFLGAWAIFL